MSYFWYCHVFVMPCFLTSFFVISYIPVMSYILVMSYCFCNVIFSCNVIYFPALCLFHHAIFFRKVIFFLYKADNVGLWIGVVNPDLNVSGSSTLGTPGPLPGTLEWIDGSAFVMDSTFMDFATVMSAGGPYENFCVQIMKSGAARSLEFVDDCKASNKYVCQFDCNQGT